MGMAASQARYLALVARKSNCEYEGQQINQTRLILANQSTNVFTQMLGLQVPVAPSKMDFAKVQYSYVDGSTTYTMDEWTQLSEPDSDGYNYVVTYHYNNDVQQGAQKMKSNPQVKFSGAVPSPTSDSYSQIKIIQSALKDIESAKETLEKANATLSDLKAKAALLSTYADLDTYNSVVSCTYDDETGEYTLIPQAKDPNNYLIYHDMSDVDKKLYYNIETKAYYTRSEEEPYTYEINTTEDVSNYVAENGTEVVYTPYSGLVDGSGEKKYVENSRDELVENGALADTYSPNNLYYDKTNQNVVLDSDLQSLATEEHSYLPVYYYNNSTDYQTIHDMTEQIDKAQNAVTVAKRNLDIAENVYNALSVPNYLGNTELTPISELDEDQVAKIQQIIADMKAEGIDTNITKCFQTGDGITYNNNTYIGGLYTYEQNGVIYYTTYYDLKESAENGEHVNNIDNQKKLPVYCVQKVATSIDKTERALLETDTSGRFTSIRLESDSVKYALSVETEIDELAYDDAMNQYNYNKALYDKRISDLNAQTSLIHQQDQDLELRLKQLDTEQNALSTEIDAVSKVVKDNVEKSFKTFGG